jgi:hypothetical protein
MQSKATTVARYLAELPPARRGVISAAKWAAKKTVRGTR